MDASGLLSGRALNSVLRCYVEKECSSAKQSLNPGMEGILFWSDNVCDDDPALVVQCPYKPQPVAGLLLRNGN